MNTHLAEYRTEIACFAEDMAKRDAEAAKREIRMLLAIAGLADAHQLPKLKDDGPAPQWGTNASCDRQYGARKPRRPPFQGGRPERQGR